MSLINNVKKSLVIISLTATSLANAGEFTTTDFIQYTVPCALSIALGGLLVKSGDGVKIGAIGCAAIASATYFNTHDAREKRIEYKIAESHEKMLQEIRDYETKKDEELALFRDTIRKVVANKFMEIYNNTEDRMNKYVDTKEFKMAVDKSVSRIINDNKNTIFKALSLKSVKERKRMMQQITDEVVKSVLNKKYAESSEQQINKPRQ